MGTGGISKDSANVGVSHGVKTIQSFVKALLLSTVQVAHWASEIDWLLSVRLERLHLMLPERYKKHC